MNHYDIEQEKDLVNDKEIEAILGRLSSDKKTKFAFHILHPNKIFLYIQSSSSQNDTFDHILQFIYKLLLEMKKIGEVPENLSDTDLEMLSSEINELILQK